MDDGVESGTANAMLTDLLGVTVRNTHWDRTSPPPGCVPGLVSCTPSPCTASTSALLPLKPGNWYYRVRGVDTLLAGTKTGLSWSDPVRLVVTKPRFKIVH